MSTARKALSLLLLPLLLGACGATTAREGADAGPDALAEIRDRGTIRVGVSEFVPWVLKDKHGKWMGFEVDVATRLAGDLGVEVELVPLPWSGLIPELQRGAIDVIASGLSITPARALLVSFSDPYHHSETTILASRERAPGLSTREEFDRPETRVAAVKGTTAEATARWALPRAEILLFDNQEQVVGAVRDGQVHAAVASSPAPRLAMLRHPGRIYLPLEKPLARTAEAFAVRKGAAELLTYLNAWIAGRAADRFLERRAAYWFASIGWEDRL